MPRSRLGAFFISPLVKRAWFLTVFAFVFANDTFADRMKNVDVRGCNVEICYHLQGEAMATSRLYPLMVLDSGTITLFAKPESQKPFVTKMYSGTFITIDYRGQFISADALNGDPKKSLFVDFKEQKIREM